MFPEILHEKIFAWGGCDYYYMDKKFTETLEMKNRNGSI